MNTYIKLIQNVIDYIEANLSERLSLQQISQNFYISEYHFNRLFKAILGMSLKQYILGRKLTNSLQAISHTDTPIINLAYDLGFEYPEVFSRAFKKQFGVAPIEYRMTPCQVRTVEKASVIERDMINFKGVLTIKADYLFLEQLELRGILLEVNDKRPDIESSLRKTGETYLNESSLLMGLDHRVLYNVVHCQGEHNGEYSVFLGKEVLKDGPELSLFQSRYLPEGWYARFNYTGDIFDIRTTFIDDLFRWIMIKEIQLSSNGVGMVSVVDEKYINNQEVKLLIPVKEPK